MPKWRMGPPPRSFAADAHDCIMVRVLGPTGYKVVARLIAPERGLPSDRHPDRTKKLTKEKDAPTCRLLKRLLDKAHTRKPQEGIRKAVRRELSKIECRT